MKLAVTQFMRPTGRPKTYEVEIPDEYESQVNLIKKNGCRITAESLMDKTAVQYISNEEVEGDFDMCRSVPLKSATTALLAMIKRFDETKFKKWLKARKAETE